MINLSKCIKMEEFDGKKKLLAERKNRENIYFLLEKNRKEILKKFHMFLCSIFDKNEKMYKKGC